MDTLLTCIVGPPLAVIIVVGIFLVMGMIVDPEGTVSMIESTLKWWEDFLK